MLERLFQYFITALVICVFVFGSFWIIKNASYYFWYKDLTIKTIQEIVKSECLK